MLRRNVFLTIAAAFTLGLAAVWLAADTAQAGTVQTFLGSSNVDLTDGTNYSPSGVPTNATDILFDTGYPTGAAIFQTGPVGSTSAANLIAESLNDLNLNSITIGNNSSLGGTGANATLTLGNSAGQNDQCAGFRRRRFRSTSAGRPPA